MSGEVERVVEPTPAALDTPPRGVDDNRATPCPDDAMEENGRLTHFLYIAVNIGSRVGMFVLMIGLTRCLSVTEYGLFALVVTMGEILEMTSTNWVRIHLLRVGAAGVRIRPDELGRSLLLVCGTGLLALVIAAVVMPMVDRGHAIQLVVGTGAYIVAFGVLRLALVLAQARQHHALYVWVEGTRAIGILVIFGFVLIWNVSDYLTVCLLLTGLTGAVGLTGVLVNLARLPAPRLTWIGYFPAVEFGVPLVLGALLAYALGWLDRLIINYFTGPAQVAFYAAAYAVARQPVELLITSLNNFVFPMLVRATASDDPFEAKRLQEGLLTTYTILGLGIMAVLSLLADPLVTLLFPPSYRASVVALIPLISFGAYCLALRNFVFGNSINVSGRTWLNLASAVPPALSTIVIGVILIRQYDEYGAGVAFALGAVIAVVAGAAFSMRALRFDIPWSRLATVVAAILSAGAATWSLLAVLNISVPIVALVIGAVTFGSAYTVCLSLFGLSVRRLITTPWAPFDDRNGRDDSAAAMPAARGLSHGG